MTAPVDRPAVLTIRLDEHETECIACGADCVMAQGLPMRDGAFIENDDPGEWAGYASCRPCFEAHRDGGVLALMYRLGMLAGTVGDPEGRALERFAAWNPRGLPNRVI